MPIKSRIRTVPHYPKQGIMFRDITTLLKDPVGLRVTIHELANRYTGMKIDKIAAIESRGFILGAPLAYLLGVGFVPIRKKANCLRKPSVMIMSLNTAPIVSKFIPMRLRRERRFCWWMT